MWGGINVPIPYIPPFNFCFTPIKGEHGALCILAIPVMVEQPGFVNGGQSKGAKWSRGGRVWFPPSQGREISFENLCMKTTFLAHWMALLGGWLCEVTYLYQSPTPPSFEKLFNSNQGGGGMAPSALSYASDGGAARICQRGAKVRERSDRAGGGGGGGRVCEGVSPSHGREIF